ncbi:hypothetical protein GCM10025867_41640 [Frondihabitans sucicola]|uniref:Secreted protein n=1 Tax=Frondihabitans sucicola TaxID=1268041 RepID=A0ABM8GTY6_9MICO|nr:hypothetical protein [Frondihabitans sucicola]BDZ51923.1 hypothetical protein GCM10025867_41640 [Frondihabitans sucicola]
MFLGVDWGAFVVVFLVALAATAVVVLAFSLGLRLLADGELEGAPAGGRSGPRSMPRSIAAWACIAVGAAAVLFALYLIIPQFHGG